MPDTPDLPTRAADLISTLSAHLATLDAAHAEAVASDHPGAIYGRRRIHVDIVGVVRGDGLAVLRELAGEVDRLQGLCEDLSSPGGGPMTEHARWIAVHTRPWRG